MEALLANPSFTSGFLAAVIAGLFTGIGGFAVF